MKRRILVTGSAGFLGRHLCRLLAELGHEPVGLDITSDPHAPFLQVVGKVEDPQAWETAGEVSGVIHGAALTDLWRPDRADFINVNVAGTEQAARFSQERDLPLVHISSYTVCMAGDRTDPQVLRGEECFEPERLIGAYAQSKRRAELALEAIRPQAIIIRPTAPIGPGDFRLTPPMRLVRDLAEGKLPGVMQGQINIVDVRDVADAVIAAFKLADSDGPSAAPRGRRYVVSGHDMGLKAFAGDVARAAGARPPALEVPVPVAALAARVETWLSARAGRPPNAPIDGVRLAALPVRFDAARAKRELGFKARPLEQSIGDAIAFVRQLREGGEGAAP